MYTHLTQAYAYTDIYERVMVHVTEQEEEEEEEYGNKFFHS